jgi:Zn-dependent peptidase ImmA (M78 family)
MPPTKPETEARKLLNRFAVATLPVPVEDIAAGLGARVVREPLKGDISGMLYRDDSNRTVIGVNSAESPVRQRFTIAHELGHLQLHPGRPVIVDKLVRVNLRGGERTFTTQREEREANRFAAELLMPATFVREAAEGVARSLPSSNEGFAKRMAETFDVSQQAMQYRLVNLGLLSPLVLEGG